MYNVSPYDFGKMKKEERKEIADMEIDKLIRFLLERGVFDDVDLKDCGASLGIVIGAPSDNGSHALNIFDIILRGAKSRNESGKVFIFDFRYPRFDDEYILHDYAILEMTFPRIGGGFLSKPGFFCWIFHSFSGEGSGGGERLRSLIENMIEEHYGLDKVIKSDMDLNYIWFALRHYGGFVRRELEEYC